MHRLVLILSAMTVACGGDDADPTTTNADTMSSVSADDSGSSSMTSLDSESSAATVEDSGDTSGIGSSDSSGAPTTSGPDTGSSEGSSGDSTTGQPSELVVEISDATSFMNCQPIVAPDPLNLSFTLDFDNQGAAVTSADVTSARLLSGDVEAVSFDLMPNAFGPFDAGETSSEAASKVEASAMPANGCDTLDCGGDYDIEIAFDVDGSVAIATGTVTVECAF